MEIERKFLVKGDGWRTGATGSVLVRQGYLTRDPERAVRVRIKGQDAFLTIKSASRKGEAALVRAEFEYKLPLQDAVYLLDHLCLRPNIEKRRYLVNGPDGKRWEIDEFVFPHAGLVLAEIELAAADEPIALPDWVGREVTHDPRYANHQIATAVLD